MINLFIVVGFTVGCVQCAIWIQLF
jgi:hypothetical protein